MNSAESKQLDLLSMFHYIVGGFIALFSCIFLVHFFIGLAIVTGSLPAGNCKSDPAPFWFGWIFVIMGAVFVLSGWAMSAAIVIAGKKLKARKGRLFCMVIAGIECMFMPFGTVLGVFTLVMLNKESVKQTFVSFDAKQSSQPAGNGNGSADEF